MMNIKTAWAAKQIESEIGKYKSEKLALDEFSEENYSDTKSLENEYKQLVLEAIKEQEKKRNESNNNDIECRQSAAASA